MGIGGIALTVGFLGIVIYTLFRSVEIRYGRRLLEPFRAFLDKVASRLYRFFVFGEIPSTYRAWMMQWFRALTHKVVVSLVALLRAIERPLSRLNHRLRRAQSLQGEPKKPSSFLEHIREAKKEHGKNPPSSL